MILRELFYFDRETLEQVDDDSYEPEHDTSPMEYDDTRKTRLRLKDINRIRKAGEFHDKEKDKELHFVRQMYSVPSEPQV